MTHEQKMQFRQLASDLSPENLHHDGERTPAQTEKARIKILKEWAKLEKKVGHKVDIDTAWYL